MHETMNEHLYKQKTNGVIDKLKVPEKPSGPSQVWTCAMSALRGMILSLILAFVSEGAKTLYSDPKVRVIFISSKRKGVLS